jgi:DNA polymerase I
MGCAVNKRFFIIDAMAMAFRNFHAFGMRPLSTKEGLPTSAVFGSAQFMLKLIEEEKPDYLVVATDSKEKTFRHDLYPEYKANRKDMPEDLAKQLPYFFELFSAMGIKVLKMPGMEADDIIGSLVTQMGQDDVHCYIVSGDKDFMQLVSPNVSLYAPKKNEPAQIISFDQVFEKFGCSPSEVIDVLAIIGDTADNVPGVHGIGDKGASKLIQEFHSLESIYDSLDKIANVRMRNALEASKERAFLARKLVTIHCEIALGHSLDEFKFDGKQGAANPALVEFFRKMEFRSLSEKMAQKLGLSGGTTTTTTTTTKSAAAYSPSYRATGPVDLNQRQQAPKNIESSSFEKYGQTYFAANSPEKLAACLLALETASVFSFDTETTGLDRIGDVPIGISVSTEAQKAWYIPLIQEHLEGWLTPDHVRSSLADILTSSHKLKVAHNLKFDLQMLNNAGMTVSGPFGDTMMQSYVLAPEGREHGLDHCALNHLAFTKIKTSELMGQGFETKMRDVPLDKLASYACEDADITLRLFHHLKPILENKNLLSVYESIEMPLVPILARMEQTGIYVDAEALAETSDQLDVLAKNYEKRVHELAGEVFNIGSPKQLQVILFEKMKLHELLGLTRLKKTKSGFSTDVTVLESMAEHELPRTILQYRTVMKLKSTYVDTLPQLIHKKTGRVHTHFHQTGTTTGRLSSSDPNLQNIPIRKAEGKQVRKAFCAPTKDRVLVSADYSQIELRLLAEISQDPGLIAAFQQDADIHTATAMKIFGIDKNQVTADIRSKAKAINFGIIYGMGPQRLARDTGSTMADAKSFIEKYFAGFPNIKAYIEDAKRKAYELGYSTTLTGRKRPILELQSRERAVVVNGENMAVNSPIQGSAADLVKKAMVDVQYKIDTLKLDAQLLLQVHDELVLECHRDIVEQVKSVVKEAMEKVWSLSVPLKVEVGSGHSWLDAH